VQQVEQLRQIQREPIIITPVETSKPIWTSNVRVTPLVSQVVSSELREARLLNSRLRDTLRGTQHKNELLETKAIELKQKISDLTGEVHRLKLNVIKLSDDAKRGRIRLDNLQSRNDICMTEIGARDDIIAKLKRQIFDLRRQQQPINSSLWKLRGAEQQKQRLEQERGRRLELAAVTEKARDNAPSAAVRCYLENLLERQRVSIARLEAQRKMWVEIERNQLMAVLGAMSLLSVSQFETVRRVLPAYSPFSKSRAAQIKYIIDRSKLERQFGDVQVPPIEPPPKFIGYPDKVAVLQKVTDPPLTTEEKQMVIRQRETPEVERRVVTAAAAEFRRSALGEADIDVTQLVTGREES
jgi:predicted  nucleic acid-binding Zn-ribbon protein